MSSAASFYQRPLPTELVAFASDEGRALFREALAEGHMEGFFALSEQFHTQADPAFCGLGSLVVALNALGIDPGRSWKGPWRWFSEELLDCCAPLEEVREKGITMEELACLARCNGAEAKLARGDATSAQDLREAVIAASRAPRGPVLVAGYGLAPLGQTGGGHFSPVGGYHAGRDLVLLLDVARFKYPPHWVPLEALHAATRTTDPATGRARGWVVLRAREVARSVLYTLAPDACVAEVVAGARAGVSLALAEDPPRDARDALAAFARGTAAVREAVVVRPHPDEAQAAIARELVATLRATELHAEVAAGIGPEVTLPETPGPADVTAALVLALPDEVWSALAAPVAEAVRALVARARAAPGLADEIEGLRAQLSALTSLAACRAR